MNFGSAVVEKCMQATCLMRIDFFFLNNADTHLS